MNDIAIPLVGSDITPFRSHKPSVQLFHRGIWHLGVATDFVFGNDEFRMFLNPLMRFGPWCPDSYLLKHPTGRFLPSEGRPHIGSLKTEEAIFSLPHPFRRAPFSLEGVLVLRSEQSQMIMSLRGHDVYSTRELMVRLLKAERIS